LFARLRSKARTDKGMQRLKRKRNPAIRMQELLEQNEQHIIEPVEQGVSEPAELEEAGELEEPEASEEAST